LKMAFRAQDLLALPVDPELVLGARNAIRTCLRVTPGDRVLLITDLRTLSVAGALASEAIAAHAQLACVVLEDHVAKRPTPVTPAIALDLLEECDIAIYAVYPQAGEITGRAQIINAAERHKIRYAHMVGITADIMKHGMRADYQAVDDISRQIISLARVTREVRVTTPAGTNLKARFDDNLNWVKTSGLITNEIWGNLPGGEVFTCPADVEGVFVCDATLGDHFSEKYGDLQDTPLRMEIEGGKLRGAQSKRRELAAEFERYCASGTNNHRVGEFALGTNIGVKHTINNLLQDEKIPGVHIAFGKTCPNQTGATWDATAHVDAIARDCDVWFDQRQIMSRGKYIL
jgi:aminopeptidase